MIFIAINLRTLIDSLILSSGSSRNLVVPKVCYFPNLKLLTKKNKGKRKQI